MLLVQHVTLLGRIVIHPFMSTYIIILCPSICHVDLKVHIHTQIDIYLLHRFLATYVEDMTLACLNNCMDFLSSFCLHCRFLDKVAVQTNSNKAELAPNPWKLSTLTQVEEVKILVKILCIWVFSIVFATIYSQMSTLCGTRPRHGYIHGSRLRDPTYLIH